MLEIRMPASWNELAGAPPVAARPQKNRGPVAAPLLRCLLPPVGSPARPLRPQRRASDVSGEKEDTLIIVKTICCETIVEITRYHAERSFVDSIRTKPE
jgi:hypothetical protein